MESGGWKGKKGTAIASSEGTRKFYTDVARAAEHFGYFSLYFLEFNNSAAAGVFGLTYGGRYYSVKIAYDETEKEYSPGHLLVRAILRDCLELGVSEFDFLEGHGWSGKQSGPRRLVHMRPATSFAKGCLVALFI